jgi:hypothetical protein
MRFYKSRPHVQTVEEIAPTGFSKRTIRERLIIVELKAQEREDSFDEWVHLRRIYQVIAENGKFPV